MKWIIGLLDFRLWNGAGQGGGGGAGQGGGGGDSGGDAGGDAGSGGPDQGGGGQGGYGGGGFDLTPWTGPAPAAPPPPAPDPVPGGPGWEWAANRQVANIDRTSQFSHEQYTSALENIHQQSLAAGPAMGPAAYDYELPDTAFGERIY